MKYYFIRLAILIVVFIIMPVLLTKFIFFKKNTDVINVYDKNSQKIITMNFDEYLIGVVASEMPAYFYEEALKAQAVAARTYAFNRMESSFDVHNGGDICTDPTHCQAYISKKEMKDKWGENYKDLYNKVKKCVIDTKDECLMYNGEYIVAVFHSCSNEKTENASDVWGGEIPYLVSVDSPGDIEKTDYISKKTMSRNEFDKVLSDNDIKKISQFTDNPIIGEKHMTIGNNVDYIYLYGEKYTGVEIRKIFSLKSSAFNLTYDGSDITFTVFGNGHGVGMSQYGAQGMAKSGNNYKDILSHYYPGTEIVNMYK